MFHRLLLVLLLLAQGAVAQEIYRVVDEHGNVTYTDRKPSDDAEPMDLPELNVLQGEDDELPFDANSQAETDDSMDFRVAAPADGATLDGSLGGLSIRLDSALEFPPAAQIVLFLDGRPLDPIRNMETAIDMPRAGPHSLRAELQTPSGRVLAATETVRFEVEP